MQGVEHNELPFQNRADLQMIGDHPHPMKTVLPPAAARISPSQPFRILIVDDDNMLRGLLSAQLKKMGMSVTSAVDGRDACQKIEKGIYDLVMSDIQMPHMDGISLLKWIKKRPAGPEVILITGCRDMDKVVQALRSGAFDFLHKPVEYEDIKEAVSRYGSRRSVQSPQDKALTLVKQSMHDIRGGLVNIAGLLKLLRRKNYDSEEELSRSLLQTIDGHLNKMVLLCEDYCAQALTFVRGDTIAEEVLDLEADVIDKVLCSLSMLIDHKKITVQSRSTNDGQGWIINANNLFIRTVFRNLFDNAVTYSPDNSLIIYTITRNGTAYEVTIENDMIPTLPRLHEDCRSQGFSRTVREKCCGLGLGLGMTEYFVSLCGGAIRCEPKKNKNRYLLTLPAYS
ncbi:MAG: response regulator [Desulfobulbaceae bacterium]|nr:response regulator [Desulfobulbaceae bacterium]